MLLAEGRRFDSLHPFFSLTANVFAVAVASRQGRLARTWCPCSQVRSYSRFLPSNALGLQAKDSPQILFKMPCTLRRSLESKWLNAKEA